MYINRLFSLKVDMFYDDYVPIYILLIFNFYENGHEINKF